MSTAECYVMYANLTALEICNRTFDAADEHFDASFPVNFVVTFKNRKLKGILKSLFILTL
uniref:PAS domain-containing protein n=1 Tax=Heterorhabditis bacteriophora TaxID=37862 RepID=A0A1I7WKJ7_HETBA